MNRNKEKNTILQWGIILGVVSLLPAGCGNNSSTGTALSEESSLSAEAQYSSSIEVVSSSSISVLSSSSEIVYGSLTDRRDGQIYKTVVIGTQTWMAQNLNYKVDSSWCYKNSVDSCAKYGRLYQWTAAMKMSVVYNAQYFGLADIEYQGVCPNEWHIPNQNEWQILYNAVNANNGSEGVGTSIKTSNNWVYDEDTEVGNNSFGFSALPAGGRYNDGVFGGIGKSTFFWSSTEDTRYTANYWYLYYNIEYFFGRLTDDKKYPKSLRCLKD